MDATTLIQHCQAGDYSAIEAFVMTYRASVFKLALSILNDPDEAEEASQDAFIAALKGINTFRGEADVKTWLFTITLNECRRRLHKRLGWERLKDQVLTLFHLEKDFEVQPEDAVIQNQRDTVLWNAVQALGDKHRLPVILFYYHDLPVTEIASVLGVRTGTVLSRLHTARERLRPALQGIWRQENHA